MAISRPVPFSALTENPELIRKLVKRVMDDGGMIRLEACAFVAAMIPGANGFDVYEALARPDVSPKTA